MHHCTARYTKVGEVANCQSAARRLCCISREGKQTSTRSTQTCNARQGVAPKLISLSLAAGLALTPFSALADGAPPVPTSEVPAAVNAVVTDENAVIEREAEAEAADSKQTPGTGGKSQRLASKVSIELTVDGSPAGRIVIGSFEDPPVGSQRFLDLARRPAGGYRLSKVDGISDAFITVSGVLQLNYSGMTPVTGGETVEQLQAEQALYPQSHDRPGLVSLVLEDAVPKDIKERVVAYKGKFIKVQEVKGAGNANGTGLAITLKAAPELDRTNLVIGRVVEGLDVVEKISKLPKVKNSKQSPFFKVAKALGDRRADVAARSFGKPLNKVVVQKVEVQS